MDKPRGLKRTFEEQQHEQIENDVSEEYDEMTEWETLHSLYNTALYHYGCSNLGETITYLNAVIHECHRLNPDDALFLKVYGDALFLMATGRAELEETDVIYYQKNPEMKSEHSGFFQLAIDKYDEALSKESDDNLQSSILLSKGKCLIYQYLLALLDIASEENVSSLEPALSSLNKSLSSKTDLEGPDFIEIAYYLNNMGEKFESIAAYECMRWCYENSCLFFKRATAYEEGKLESKIGKTSSHLALSSYFRDVKHDAASADDHIVSALNEISSEDFANYALASVDDLRLIAEVYLNASYLKGMNKEENLKSASKYIKLAYKIDPESVAPELVQMANDIESGVFTDEKEEENEELELSNVE